jgi:hypothetical protein
LVARTARRHRIGFQRLTALRLPHFQQAMIRPFLLLVLTTPLVMADDAFFTGKVQPVLETHCVSCHNPDKTKGKLLMTTVEGMMKGGENGAVVVPGKPEESALMKRITLPKDDDDIMPPEGGPLAAADIDVLKQWIAQGAGWPAKVTLKAKGKGAAAPPKIAKETVMKVRSMAVYPEAITLETRRDFNSFVAVATFEDDVTQDVTGAAKLTLTDPAVAKLDGFKLLPLKDGATKLVVEWHDKKVEVPVTVKDAAKDRPVSFNLDVMPVFMRANCNTGSCHGSARGQDGFRLSLFGFDPKGDHFRLTQELSGRRINLALPEESLTVTKSTGEVPHTGGKKVEPGSPMYKTLVEWITSGVPYDPPDVAKPVSVDIYPKNAVLEGEGAKLQFTVRAKYSDGHDRDVTPLAVFMSNNDPTAKISPDGLVTAAKRGEAFVMARFETFTVGSQVIVIPENLKYTRPQYAANNYIDGLVADKLHRLRIYPSDVCDDETFLRRVSIDITGTLPSEEDYGKFMASKEADKRAKLVDELLARKEFTEIWVMKWAELLQIRTNPNNQVSYKATLLYFNWLKDRISNNVPFNKIVQELLAADGGTFTNPATNYYQIERDTLKVSENVAQVFMGMRLQCAQCHNHPFDRWTMNDYYGFASFFSQVGRKQAEDPRETVVFNSGGGEVNHIVTKAPQKPKLLGAAEPDVAGKDRRKVMVEWLASPQNPYFATNLSNIVWSHFFGIGIVQPVDDVRISNPASNRELLDELGKKLTEYNYDFKRLVRDICTSRTYQLSSQVNESNEGDSKNFSHSILRRQRAEIMLDSISSVTDTKNKFQGLPLGARAVQIADGNVSTYFLRTFGRAERATVCSCEVKMDPNLGQALHLLNGDITQNKIGEGQTVKKMLDAKKTPEQVLESLYIRCFSRKPSAPETKPVMDAITATPKETQQVLEDTFWALLNSKEFMFNH